MTQTHYVPLVKGKLWRRYSLLDMRLMTSNIKMNKYLDQNCKCLQIYKTDIGVKIIGHLFSLSKSLEGPSTSEKMVRLTPAKCLVLQSEEEGSMLPWECFQEKCSQRQVFLPLRKPLERNLNWRLQLLNPGIAWKWDAQTAVLNNSLLWSLPAPVQRSAQRYSPEAALKSM